MEPLFRTIEPEDRTAALALWYEVFGDAAGYFERYYHDDPWCEDGDSLGAWVDGRLVSAVHLCRRPLSWNGGIVWCGGIANVATRREFRRRGLSRSLLRLVIRRMEETGVAFSWLGTGAHGHYGALGWERIYLPRAAVHLGEDPIPLDETDPAFSLPWTEPGDDSARLVDLYQSKSLRPLAMQRPSAYFDGWVQWGWRSHGVRICSLAERGYLAATYDAGAHSLRVLEWCAANADDERELLINAAVQARRLGAERIELEGAPEFGGMEALAALGRLEPRSTAHDMIRNVSLPVEQYNEIVRLYERGSAVWWAADGF